MVFLATILIIVGVSVALFAFVYRPSTFEGRRYREAEESTELPDFMERTIGNMTGWRFVHNSSFRSAKMTRMLDMTGNPWGVTQLQFYALMTLSGLAGGAVGAIFGLFSYGTFFLGTISQPIIGIPLFLALGVAVGFAVGWVIPYSLLQQKFSRHQSGFVAALADLEDLFATASASGQTLEQSIRTAYTYLPEGPARVEMSRLITDLNRAVSLPDAVEGMMERIPSRHVRVFGMLLIDLYVNGSAPAEALRREASEMRHEQTREIKERANKVQGFVVAGVMVFAIPAVLVAFAPGFLPTIMDSLSDLGGGDSGGGLF